MNPPHSYWSWRTLANGALTKPGLSGYPHLEPAQDLLLEVIEALTGTGHALDLSARGGAVALRLQANGWVVSATDDSASSLAALQKLGLSDAGGAGELVCSMLSAERGNTRVAAQVAQAWSRTAAGGVLLLAGDKDKGFERYFKAAVQVFGDGEVVRRGNGYRVARLVKTKLEPPVTPAAQRFTFSARGRTIECSAQPGVFAAGKLDAASAVMLSSLPSAAGKRVLDIGAGYGALGVTLALEGGVVTMLESDAPSAQSCLETLALNGLTGTVLHSDVDAQLDSSARFDWVVMNPPFHIGRDLKLEVALEFIAAAGRRLKSGGEIWLVANHFLPYETALADLGVLEVVTVERGFKLLHVTRA